MVTAALGGVQFCFRQPHRPWQKPTVENTNGLQGVLPEGHGFLEGDGEEGRAFRLINDRPRKVLGYRTANEACWEGLPHSA